MGGEWSSLEREASPDPWWGNSQPGTSRNVPTGSGENTEKTEEKLRRKVNQEEMDAFKKEMSRKRELRRAAIASVQNEMKRLKSDLEAERTLRKTIEDERDQLKKTKCDKVLFDEVERLKSELNEEKVKRKDVEEENNKLKEKEGELEAVEHQVKALKEVASIGREMLRIRELQVNELKRKLQEIELSLPTAPEELRLEYEAQIQNIRKLRTLYEERALATRTEHQQERERDTAKINMLELKVNEQQEEIQEQKDKNTSLEVKITKFEETVEEKITEIESLQDQLYSSSVECRSLKSQMKIINNLFSQVLAGPEFDLDRLTRLLKENHGLITDLTATGDSNEVAALLLDIAEKAEGDTQGIHEVKQDETEDGLQKEKEDIATNLSKVWRVLVELLSHHKDVNVNAGGSESCYKSIDTPSGPRLVISVSQTFLTLKDLILEKNSLVKEAGRLKTLNKHLESRMQGQERRLSTVTTELKKTWSVVSKLRAQHKQLHNHEKILRYELQHKRQMLTELKQELEHCREKWDRARQKNTQSEEDWKQLRKEFAMRKMRKLSNSAESGYEEEDSHSSPSEEISEPSDAVDRNINVIPVKQDTSESSDGDLSEEDVEHSDGNSYETVIDLLDIACLESQVENENLTNTEELISFIESQEAARLTDTQLNEVSHIESFELGSELDIGRTNIPSPNFNSPSSSGSSPIPTETEDLTSSELDISEEIPRCMSPYHQLHFTEEPIVVPDIPQDNFLFGSHAAQNVSRFLEGLIVTDVPSMLETNVAENNSRERSSESCLPEIIDSEQPTNHEQENFQSITDVLTEDEHLSTQEIETSLPTLQEERLSEEGNFLSTLLLETNRKYEIPQINIVCENESSDQESPEIKDSLNNEKSVFDSECVANAIQLCLQDIQNSIPVTLENEEVETVEINNNIPAVTTTVIESSTVSAESECKANNATSNDEDLKTEEIENQDENSNIENKIEIQDIQNVKEVASTSGNELQTDNVELKPTRTPKEILEARAARLKRLEDQCKSLFSKMSATSRRSDMISNKLEELHEHYGPSHSAKNSSEIPSSPVPSIDDSLQGKSSGINDSEKPLEKKFHSELVINRLNDPVPEQIEITSHSLPEPCWSTRLETSVQAELVATSHSLPDTDCTKRLETPVQAKQVATSHSLPDTGCSKRLETSVQAEQVATTSHTLPEPSWSKRLESSVQVEQIATTSHSLSDSGCSKRLETSVQAEQVTTTSQSSPDPCCSNRLETSVQETATALNSTENSLLDSRAARLKRLEEQCKSLFDQVTRTNQKSNVICNKLQELHEHYGSPEGSASDPDSNTSQENSREDTKSEDEPHSD